MGDDVVSELFRAGRDAWPDIDVAAARFASEARRRAKDAALETLKGADLYFAIACSDGNERAAAAAHQMIEREVAYASSKTSATRDQVAEVTAEVAKQLLVDGALLEYSGRGHLKGYISVIATRALFRHVNKARREVGIEDDAVIDRIVPQSDPEISILRAQYREVVDDAMRAAIRTLDDRGRALLRYAFVDGWSVDKVGKLYNVHRATASRWIAAVREELGDAIRDELATRLEVAVDDVDSIVRLVQSRIDVSLDRMLGQPG